MIEFGGVKIRSYPEVQDEVYCPKHRKEMLQLGNGWFGICWYCKECGYPYHLEMRKMKVVNKEALKEAIKKAENKKQKNA